MNEYRNETTEEMTARSLQAMPKKRRHSRLRRLAGRIIAALITVLLITGAVYLVVNRDTISVDSLLHSIGNLFSDSAQADSYRFSSDGETAVTQMQGGLLVCSETDLQLYTQAGECVINETINFAQPVVQADGSYGVAYDTGGSTLYLIYSEQVLRTYTSSKDNGILSARIDANGYLTVVERATGYKAAITVYTAALEPIITENISSAFISDASLSQDGKILAAVSVGEDTSGFDSVIIFYDVSDGEEIYRCALGSDVVLDLKWDKEGLWVMGEYGAYYVQDGAVTAQSVDQSRVLQTFTLLGNNFAAFCTSKYQNGNSTTVEVLDASGSTGLVTVSEDVISLSAAGEYLAVLTANQLIIYQSDLTIYAQADNSWSARKAFLRENGSVLLITNDSAEFYRPD